MTTTEQFGSISERRTQEVFAAVRKYYLEHGYVVICCPSGYFLTGMVTEGYIGDQRQLARLRVIEQTTYAEYKEEMGDCIHWQGEGFDRYSYYRCEPLPD